MTTLQIDSNDKIAIDEKLKILKSHKFKKEGNLAKAFSSLNQKIGNIENIDIAKDKQEYFNKKYAL